jgi:CDP-4-dehydro-6-deoxyglucose reductase
MSFKVRIEPSGHEFHTQGNETILEAALREGYNLPYSCRNGACGTCKGALLSGKVELNEHELKALRPEEQAAGKTLFCRAVPQSDVVIEAREIGAAKDIVIKIMPCRVAKMERLAPDVMALFLKLPQNERLQFLAGQYIDILLRDGRRRGFSLANAPHDDAFLQLHVRHVPGGVFSGHVFTDMKEKALLRFEGPLGTFFLREDSDRPIILMAGGTGFAPMKGIVEHALYVGIKRPIHLYWGARARVDLYMHELASSWTREHPHVRYTPVLSEPRPEDAWSGRTGWVHEAVMQDYADLSDHEVYASGPPAMIEAARAAFPGRGLADDRFYYDSFEYAKDVLAANT